MDSRNICCIIPFPEGSMFIKYTSDGFSKFRNVKTVGVKYAKEMPETVADLAYSVPGIIERAKEAEKEGYEGIIIGCFGDTGYSEAKEVVNIPIVGPGLSSIVLAHMIGYRFSIMTAAEMFVIPTEKLIRQYGLSTNLSSIRYAESLGTRKEPQKVINDTIDKIIECIEKDRADVVILGCMEMIGMADDIRKVITRSYNIHIINPAEAAYYMINTLIGMKQNSLKSMPGGGSYRKGGEK